MRCFADRRIRFVLQILSILPLLLIRNAYGHAAISIYYRYPVAVLLLGAVLLFGVWSRTKYSRHCECFAYIALVALLLYRITVEMEGFLTGNRLLYGVAAYVQCGVGVVLFVLLLLYYAKRTASFRSASRAAA